jgi:hypothetical protein
VRRRDFLSHGLAAAAGVAIGQWPRAWEPSAPATDGVRLPDFSRSFVINTAPFNSVRFWIESRTTLIDGSAQTVFYQCGSMKAEDTFADRDLFYPDNWDFMPIFSSAGHALLLRRRATVGDRDREIVTDIWGVPRIEVVEAPYRELTSWVAMRDTTAAGTPLVTRTTIEGHDGLRAVIECPTKTMNISLEAERYQVDVGPVALPDVEHRHDQPLDGIRLAFLAFTSGDWVSFITQQPAPVGGVQVYHYAEPFDMPAVNEVFAL